MTQIINMILLFTYTIFFNIVKKAKKVTADTFIIIQASQSNKELISKSDPGNCHTKNALRKISDESQHAKSYAPRHFRERTAMRGKRGTADKNFRPINTSSL